ncbi:MAG: AAA family ATPase [Synergistaceae bacterium]|nr:AAA family ATPase [Synergistaceae bacterium]
MTYERVPENLIMEQFTEFLYSAEGGALAPIESIDLILDKKVRYKVEGDKGSKTSGEYLIHSDGCPAGYVINYKYSSDAFTWRFDFKNLKGDKQYDKYYALSQTPEFKAEAKRIQEERKKQDAQVKADALIRAKKEFDNAPKLINPELDYLKDKHVGIHGELKSDKDGNILLPLRDIRGEFKSMQRILPDGSKRFAKDTSPSGAFFNIDLDKANGDTSKPIIICEGYATGATLYELTSCPVVCAMNCGGLDKTAEALLKTFRQHKIIIMADNDAETARKQGKNPGLDHANAANKKYNLDGVFAPDFDEFLRAAGCSDWNDYYCEYGELAARERLTAHVKWACMSVAERNRCLQFQQLQSAQQALDITAKIPPQEFIADIFPKGAISMVVGASGVGKTWFMLRLVCDLSVGGSILDGFAYEPKPKRIVIFAGETGYELLIRRLKAANWNANKDNVTIYSSLEARRNKISLDLDNARGQANITSIVKEYRPDIIFFDTLSAFHTQDENKADAMKPIVNYLMDLGNSTGVAETLMHHTRKRKTKEQQYEMTQDEVIGTSILNRDVALLIGIEAAKDEVNNEAIRMGGNAWNIVRPLKSWYAKFSPFSYRIVNCESEDEDGQEQERVSMEINLTPPQAPSVKNIIWEYIERNYEKGQWFKAGVLREAIGVSRNYITRCLDELVKNEKLNKRGERRGVEYAIKGFYD